MEENLGLIIFLICHKLLPCTQSCFEITTVGSLQLTLCCSDETMIFHSFISGKGSICFYSHIPPKVKGLCEGLLTSLHAEELAGDSAECDVILAFCPVVSRLGTDVEAALKEIPDTRHCILIVMHFTFDPDYVIPDSKRFTQGRHVDTVDCLFHEDAGLLQCLRNDAAIKEILTLMEPYSKEGRKKKDKKERKERKTLEAIVTPPITGGKLPGGPPTSSKPFPRTAQDRNHLHGALPQSQFDVENPPPHPSAEPNPAIITPLITGAKPSPDSPGRAVPSSIHKRYGEKLTSSETTGRPPISPEPTSSETTGRPPLSPKPSPESVLTELV
ncbi:uncharacterized protein LOC134468190 [Engraulis encrasicolus]|uniref:uncharacterized protein LOC134468190 n=1 Tax=Engraulis encrasicolus TaxID=184585 RepID=UPI002FD70E9B